MLAEPGLLKRMFSALTEYTFLAELGVTDTRLIDYLSEFLARFVHRDALYAIRGPQGRRLEELADMIVEAERLEHRGSRRREIYRHMGDFSLFWTGVYPEAIEARGHVYSKDSLINYYEIGKRSYHIASMYADTPTQAAQSPILRRLSDEFELYSLGLRKVRSHWEHGDL
jgi:hypothetical protein